MIINKVKELVNLIASKDEATGYISDSDYNRFGSMAQAQKLEEDLELKNENGTFVMSSLSSFKKTSFVNSVSGFIEKPSDYRSFETASYPSATTKSGEILYVPFEQLETDVWNWRISSELEAPDNDFPALHVLGTEIETAPKNIQQVKLVYVFNPPDIVWGYTIQSNRKVWAENGASSGGVDAIDFTFGEDDIVNLVYRILTLAGVSFREAELVQVAAAQEAKNLQL